jgi:hypothetical protein
MTAPRDAAVPMRLRISPTRVACTVGLFWQAARVIADGRGYRCRMVRAAISANLVCLNVSPGRLAAILRHSASIHRPILVGGFRPDFCTRSFPG